MLKIYSVNKGYLKPPWLSDISKWLKNSGDSQNTDINKDIGSFPDLSYAALRARGNDMVGNILLVTGFKREEVTKVFRKFISPYQLIVEVSNTREQDERCPIFSFAHEREQHKPRALNAIFFTADNSFKSTKISPPIENLKLSILKFARKRKIHQHLNLGPMFNLHASVDVSQSDLINQYFNLRYQVWKEMEYIQPELDCSEVEWELDFTDRTATPFVAIDKDTNQIVGCIRLIQPMGIGNESFRQLESYIHAKAKQSGFYQVLKNIEYPVGLQQPFDLNSAFEGFNKYYHSLAKQKLRRGEVSRLIVSSKFRNQGVAEALMDELIEYSQHRGIEVLFLSCASNHQRFYEKCGFKAVTGLETTDFVNAPNKAIVMERYSSQIKANKYERRN